MLHQARLMTVFAISCSLMCGAQSIKCDDLLNLQKSNLDKVKGFFSYKGWTWGTTNMACLSCFQYKGYDLTYNDTYWTQSGGEKVQYLWNAGSENVILYYPRSFYDFNLLENEVKQRFTSNGTSSSNNILGTEYRNGGVLISFNSISTVVPYSRKLTTSYEVCITDANDLTHRIAILCANCKGKGHVTEYEKCSSCSGDGKKNCWDCSGKGMVSCDYCNEGKKQCRSCYGKTVTQCNTCYGRVSGTCLTCLGRKSRCTTCRGNGYLLKCGNCGSAKINLDTPRNGEYYCYAEDGVYQPVKKHTCSFCSGNGEISCKKCNGTGTYTCDKCEKTGKITCANCIGVGTVKCTSCFGDYSAACQKCNGKGKTGALCSYCNGKGHRNKEVNKVCTRCDGTKLNKD